MRRQFKEMKRHPFRWLLLVAALVGMLALDSLPAPETVIAEVKTTRLGQVSAPRWENVPLGGLAGTKD